MYTPRAFASFLRFSCLGLYLSASYDLIFTSYLYDSELCGFLIIPEENSDILYLSNYYPEDDKKRSCSEKREKLDDSYIEEIKNTLKDNDEEIQDFLSNIRKNYSYYNDSNVESDEKIDFEKLKQININKKYNEDIFEGNTSIETYKNSILYNTEDIDKQEYIKTYLNVGIYDFIRIFNENNNFDLTNSIINIDYEFNADFIKNLVIKDGYISNELNSLEKENYLNSLTVNELKEILKDYDKNPNTNYSIEIIEEIITLVNIYLGMQVHHYPAFTRLIRKKYIENELLSQNNYSEFEIPDFETTVAILSKLELDNKNNPPKEEREQVIRRYEKELEKLDKYTRGRDDVYKNEYSFETEEERTEKLVTNIKSINKKLFNRIMQSKFPHSKQEELINFIINFSP